MTATRSALRWTSTVSLRSLTPVRGLITAIPVTALFALSLTGVATTTAITMAIAANLIAVASLVGAPQLSLRLALGDAAGIAIGAFLGALTASSPWLHDAALLPWCFLAGLTVFFGPTQAVIGSQVIVGFVVLGRHGATPLQAAILAGWVMLGAGAEILALLILRLPSSLRSQRASLARALDAVAAYAEAPPHESALAALAAIDEAQRVLTPAPLFGRSDVRDLQSIVDQLRRSRIELTTIAGLRLRLDGRHTAVIDGVLVAYAAALRNIATEIRQPVAVASEPPQHMRARLAALDTAIADDDDTVLLRQVQQHLAALRSQLRSCRDLARRERADTLDRGVLRRRSAVEAGVNREDGVWATASARLRPNDVGFRHAVRLALAVTASMIVAQVFALPRGYWVAFSVAVILKPDYVTLLQRGVSRVVGTAAGASLAALLVAELHPSLGVSVLLVAAVATAAYTTWAASFAVSIGLVSSLVLIVLSSIGHDAIGTAADRFLDVTIGAVIAASTYLLWPSSQEQGLVASERAFGEAVAAYLEAVFSNASLVAQRSREAHLAYAAVVAAAERHLNEPGSSNQTRDDVRSLVATGLRLLRGAHALRLGTTPHLNGANATALEAFTRALLGTLRSTEGATIDAAFDALESCLADVARAASYLLTLDELANAATTWRDTTERMSS